jgi:hypothetical protein
MQNEVMFFWHASVESRESMENRYSARPDNRQFSGLDEFHPLLLNHSQRLK